MNKKDELTQIVRLVQSDKENFEQLYSLIVNKVYYWCYTITNDEAMAKDMMQEAMIRIYNKIDKLQEPENFTSWMYRLVRNCCINYLKKEKGISSDYLYDDVNENMISTIKDSKVENIPNEAYSLQETKKLIRSFVEALPKKQKEVIVLYYLEEFSTTEIADILGSNLNTVRVLLHKGRKKLELEINEYQEKNNVRLYSTILLALLGIILQEHQVMINDRQDLHFDKGKYDSTNISAITKITGVLSTKVIAAVIITTIVVGILGYFYLGQANSNVSIDGTNITFISDILMFNKRNGNSYVKSINYNGFPTKEPLIITITLKQKMEKEDIIILTNDKKVSFEVNEKDIVLKAFENGQYRIIINKKEVSFEITNIDPEAPELVSVDYYSDYLQLNIDDSLSQIDYGLSYIEYDGNYYTIDNNLQVQGQFSGIIIVGIYINENCYRKYFIEI